MQIPLKSLHKSCLLEWYVIKVARKNVILQVMHTRIIICSKPAVSRLNYLINLRKSSRYVEKGPVFPPSEY